MKEILSKVSSRPNKSVNDFNDEERLQEFIKITETGFSGFVYFVVNYVYIYDNQSSGYINFDLWDTDVGAWQNQLDICKMFYEENRVAVLKSRQVGISWLALSYCLFMSVFFPEQQILLLSKGDTEAKALLSRFKRMYGKLPEWMKPENNRQLKNNEQLMELSNGSSVISLPTTGGDSMTFTICLVDEADLIYRSGTTLYQVLLNAEPTIGVKGKLFLISKSDKKRPRSTFKNICRAAMSGKESMYKFGFVPWNVNKDRTAEWYERQRKASFDIDGTLDSLEESYPSDPDEAMTARSSDKKIPFTALRRIFEEREPIPLQLIKNDGLGNLAPFGELRVYLEPQENTKYIILLDPSGGLPHSDDTVITVWDINRVPYKQVLVLSGKIHFSVAASITDTLNGIYGAIGVLYERNNHGHGYQSVMKDNYRNTLLLYNTDEPSNKMAVPEERGFFSTKVGKTIAYSRLEIKIMQQELCIYDRMTFEQLSSIEDSTLSAPKGEYDDHATVIMMLGVVESYLPPSFEMELIKVF